MTYSGTQTGSFEIMTVPVQPEPHQKMLPRAFILSLNPASQMWLPVDSKPLSFSGIPQDSQTIGFQIRSTAAMGCALPTYKASKRLTVLQQNVPSIKGSRDPSSLLLMTHSGGGASDSECRCLARSQLLILGHCRLSQSSSQQHAYLHHSQWSRAG